MPTSPSRAQRSTTDSIKRRPSIEIDYAKFRAQTSAKSAIEQSNQPWTGQAGEDSSIDRIKRETEINAKKAEESNSAAKSRAGRPELNPIIRRAGTAGIKINQPRRKMEIPAKSKPAAKETELPGESNIRRRQRRRQRKQLNRSCACRERITEIMLQRKARERERGAA